MTSNSKLVSSLFWRMMERVCSQVIQLVIQILLARLLLPADYGVIDILLVFVNLMSIIIQNGFSTALIQNKDTNELDYDSVLWLNIIVSVLLYTVLYAVAPFIASYYKNESYTLYLRVLALILFPGAVIAVQNAIVAREMLFKEMFYRSTFVAVTAGFVGLTAAYAGLGVWALILYNLATNFILPIIMMIRIRWRPKLRFSLVRIKGLFSFGWKVLAVSIMNTLYNDLRTLVIGKVYTSQDLAFYNRGQVYPSMIVTNLSYAISSVMLPSFSSNQDDDERMLVLLRRSIGVGAMILSPCLIGFASVAEQFVEIFLTDKWLPCVPFLQIFCIYRLPYFIHSITLQAVNAKGRSDIYLKIYTLTNVLNLFILIITMRFGIIYIAVGATVISYVRIIINGIPCRRMFGYTLGQQVLDILPHLIRSFIMGLIASSVRYLNLPVGAEFVAMIVVGIAVYIVLLIITKCEEYKLIKKMLKDRMRGRRGENGQIRGNGRNIER